MTHEQLIAKARDHLRQLERTDPLNVSSDAFTDARVVEAALIYLGHPERDDHIEVCLDRETGELTTVTYSPPSSSEE